MSGEGRTLEISAHLKARSMTARRDQYVARGKADDASWAVIPGEANDATAQSIPGQRQTGGAMLRRRGATGNRVGYVRCVDGMCDGSRGLRSGRGMHLRVLWGRDWSRCGRCVRGGRGIVGDLRGVRSVCGKGQGLCVDRRARGEATGGSGSVVGRLARDSRYGECPSGMGQTGRVRRLRGCYGAHTGEHADVILASATSVRNDG
jgi:hypothetical protein